MPTEVVNGLTELSTTISRKSGATVVAAIGDIDLATAAGFDDAIAAAIREADDGAVIVDLVGVRFCDSSGIRSLVRGRRLADEQHIAYQIVGAQGVVLDVLRITGVWADLSGESPS